MKSLAELAQLREKTLAKINLRKEDDSAVRVVVGMATCGIAAGARPVLNAFVDEVAKRNLKGVTVSQTGCIGMCQYEPIVEVIQPGKEKVTYVKMTAYEGTGLACESTRLSDSTGIPKNSDKEQDSHKQHGSHTKELVNAGSSAFERTRISSRTRIRRNS